MTWKEAIRQTFYAIILFIVINILIIFFTHKNMTLTMKGLAVNKDAPPGMVYIPKGILVMGTDPEEEEEIPESYGMMYEPYRDEAPRHNIYLDGFYIDKYEVTVAQYRKFCQATEHDEPDIWKDSLPKRPDNYPAYGITWVEATAYAKWAGKRLPTEAEWEKAARGTAGRKFVWGDSFNPKIIPYLAGIYQVGTNPVDVSPFYEIHDLTANVSEWTAEYYAPYPGNDYLREIRKKGENRLYVWRGYHHNVGTRGHYDIPYFYRAAYRGLGDPATRYPAVGFRCVQDLEKNKKTTSYKH